MLERFPSDRWLATRDEHGEDVPVFIGRGGQVLCRGGMSSEAVRLLPVGTPRAEIESTIDVALAGVRATRLTRSGGGGFGRGVWFDAHDLAIRRYSPDDEQAWLRCRVLGFLGTAYFDDVLTAKPTFDTPAVELVAERAGTIVGVIDVDVPGESATIETIAVHPDFARTGIGSALLHRALVHLPGNVKTLDAWTRDDAPANGWYLANGFRENFRYLHVYASGDHEPTAAIVQTRSGLTPVAAFFHADISTEATMRSEFSRVHTCRQYVRTAVPSDRPSGGQPPG